jgi:NAD(P)-dependent dehydrogenase (short-subunit alcohol dehydrogenase family)
VKTALDTATKTALVTGATRGLGLETARQLLQKGHRVIATARSDASAKKAADELARLTDAPDAPDARRRLLHHALDTETLSGLEELALFLEREKLALDALVNNAGIAMDGFDSNVVKHTIATNFHGPRIVTKTLRPLLAKGASVVMVSSGMADLSAYDPALRERFLDPSLDEDGLVALVDEFGKHVAAGDHRKFGWPSSAYRVSKAALNMLVRIWANDYARSGMVINAVSPGWARTDMGGRGAPRSVEDGAKSIVWAALLTSGGPNGGFYDNGRSLEW